MTFPLVVVLLLLSTEEAGADPYRYLSRTRNSTESAERLAWLWPVADNGTRSTVSDTDDAPLERVDLAFAAPFFGREFRYAFVSPNGGLHFDATPPCASNTFGFGLCALSCCDFSTAYDNAVGALLGDSYPGLGGTVRFAADNASLAVVWDGVFPYASDAASVSAAETSTFAARVTSAGAVQILVERPGAWQSGLWSDDRVLVGARGRLDDVDGLVVAESAGDWDTTQTRGVYPSVARAREGELLFELCPMPASLCLNATAGALAGGEPLRVSGAGAPMGCAGVLDLWCSFNGTLTAATIADDAAAAECRTPPSAVAGPVSVDLVYVDEATGALAGVSNGSLPEFTYGSGTAAAAAGNCSAWTWAQADCNGTVGGTHVVDEDGACCDVGEVDCGGHCGGSLVGGPRVGSSVTCCEADCAGWCEQAGVENAAVDDCGQCAGGQSGVVAIEFEQDTADMCFVPCGAAAPATLEVSSGSLRVNMSVLDAAPRGAAQLLLTNTGNNGTLQFSLGVLPSTSLLQVELSATCGNVSAGETAVVDVEAWLPAPETCGGALSVAAVELELAYGAADSAAVTQSLWVEAALEGDVAPLLSVSPGNLTALSRSLLTDASLSAAETLELRNEGNATLFVELGVSRTAYNPQVSLGVASPSCINISAGASALVPVDVSLDALLAGDSSSDAQVRDVTIEYATAYAPAAAEQRVSVWLEVRDCAGLAATPCIRLPGCYYCALVEPYEAHRRLLEDPRRLKSVVPTIDSDKALQTSHVCVDGTAVDVCAGLGDGTMGTLSIAAVLGLGGAALLCVWWGVARWWSGRRCRVCVWRGPL